jgi:hypothetical protein
VATRASIVDDGCANRDHDNSVMRGPGRRRRCWLILANVVGWAVIILTARAVFF